MAKKAYIGVGGVARKVKQTYIGVDGVSRKCKSGYVGVDGVARQFLQSGILASEIAVGSIVYLMENGRAVEYLVVNQGTPGGSSDYDVSCDGMWIMRKNIFSLAYFNDTDQWVLYKDATINTYLQNTFYPQLGYVERSTLKRVKIPYCKDTAGNVETGSNGASVYTFLLSAKELGFSGGWGTPEEGAILSYFSDGSTTKRIAYYNGTATRYWLRSLNYTGGGQAKTVNANGSMSGCTNNAAQLGVRPAIVLPKNAIFDPATMILKGVA